MKYFDTVSFKKILDCLNVYVGDWGGGRGVFLQRLLGQLICSGLNISSHHHIRGTSH